MKQKVLHMYYALLAFFARMYLRRHQPYVIGINGSVGKTSCRMIIAQTLQQNFQHKKVYTSNKNFNGELGLSLSIFQVESFDPNLISFLSALRKAFTKTIFGSKPYDILILEYGIDRPNEMDFLLSIVRPQMGVFTAIDAVHSEQFGDPAKIAYEEAKMVKNTRELAFLNIDDGYASALKDHVKIDYLTYQTQGYDSKADIKFENEKFVLGDLQGDVAVEFDLRIKNKKFKIRSNVLGKAHYGYIGVALSILEILSYKEGMQNIFKAGELIRLDYTLQPGRLSVFPGLFNSIIIDSSYNSSPLSVKKIINTVYSIRKQLFPQRKVWLVLGDMKELGDFTQQEHRLLATYVSSVADCVFLVGEHMVNYLADELLKVGYDPKLIYTFDKATKAAKKIKEKMGEAGHDLETIIVCKGSQNTIFLEEVVKKLLKNPEDEKRLTRQSKRRLQKKAEFFGEDFL